MLSRSPRYLLIVVLLLAGVGLTWGQRWSAAAKLSAELPAAPEPAAQGASAESPPAHIYFLDIEGWYRITPYETVVRSRYDLTGGTTEAIAEALPATLGKWQQVGEDQYIGDDPAVVEFLNHPTVALQRVYEDAAGYKVTLNIIGNKGEDSFLLFSHTPETCYPGRLWQVVENRRESALLDGQPMYAQYLLTQHAQSGDKLMVLFWYLWDSPQRSSVDGVLSVRVNVYLPPDGDEDASLEQAWSFIRELFPETVPWDRF
jgi:hypothetical protein